MSEKLLPIVPGCKAITINCLRPENNGKSATVIRRTDLIFRSPYEYLGDVWETDVKESLNIDGVQSSLCGEKQLLRIDGGEFSHEKDSHELGIKA
jgi:hypothetical protein